MSKRIRLFENDEKVVYEGPEPGTLVQQLKEEITATAPRKKGGFEGKGALGNRISEYLLLKLNEIGVPTNFIKRLNMREQLLRQVEEIPVSLSIHNVAAGEFAKRFGLEEGMPLPRSILEFTHKSEKLGNPFVSDEHITAFGWATPQELEEMIMISMRVNDYLSGLFYGIGLRLIDFRIDFGRYYDSNEDSRIVLTDGISPENCRLWDAKTNKKINGTDIADDLTLVKQAYQEIAKRLGILPDNTSPHLSKPTLVD